MDYLMSVLPGVVMAALIYAVCAVSFNAGEISQRREINMYGCKAVMEQHGYTTVKP